MGWVTAACLRWCAAVFHIVSRGLCWAPVSRHRLRVAHRPGARFVFPVNIQNIFLSPLGTGTMDGAPLGGDRLRPRG